MGRELRALLMVTVVACVVAALVVAERQRSRTTGSESAPPATAPDRWHQSPGYPKPDPAPPLPDGHLVVHVKPGHAVDVRFRPNGRVLTRLGPRTEFGSARALSVLSQRRGRWLGVTTPQLPNGELGWVDARSGGLRYSHSPVEVEVDLSRRQLLVRHADEVVRRATVSIGRAGSTTPTGRFAVTDKLPGMRYSSVYGCCILALSGTQPNLPAGWPGGNRLAIHGTPDEGSIGGRRSAGCVVARAGDLRWLMASLPLGTPVRIHA
jgi:L,D-transpeptidase catalytic domain